MQNTNWEKWLVPIIVLALIMYWLVFHLYQPPNVYIPVNAYRPPTYDMEISYTMNALLPFKGINYQYIAYPSIPLYVLGTAVLALTYPLTLFTEQPFVMFHLEHMTLIYVLLRLIMLGVSLWVFVYTFRWVKTRLSVWLGIAAALSFFAFYMESFSTLINYSHTPIGYVIGTPIMVFLATQAASGTLKPKHLYGAAILSGLMIAIVIYYVPYAIGVVLISLWWGLQHDTTRSKQARFVVLTSVSVVLGFLLGILPIINRVPDLIGWGIHLLTHQGHFGQGEAGFGDINEMIQVLIQTYRYQPLLFWMFFLAFIASIPQLILRRKEENHLLWLQIIFFIQWATMLILIAKHPGLQYLSAVAPMLPAILFVAFWSYRDTLQNNRIGFAIATLVMLTFAVNYVSVMQDHINVADRVSTRQAATDAFIQNYADQQQQSVDDLTLLADHGTHFLCFGLWFGGGSFTGYYFQGEIGQLCSQTLYFEANNTVGRTPQGDKDLQDPNFCWDVAISMGMGDYLAESGTVSELDGGYYATVNNRFTQPTTAYRQDFDGIVCGTGWHQPESFEGVTYTWMASEQATVRTLLDDSQDYMFTVNVFASAAPNILPSLKLVVNDEPLTLQPTGNMSEYAIDIPKELIQKNPYTTHIALQVDEVVSPSESDPRLLGVAIDSIRIEPIADAE